jgi:hypothetical protein
MRVLVACEESQAVCKAFRERGHEAYSCDIIECSGGHPEWHIQGDVLGLLNPQKQSIPTAAWHGFKFRTMDGVMHCIDGRWDLIIAHPPCTYLSNAGAARLYKKFDGKSYCELERLNKGFDAKEFFMAFFNAQADKIAIENPIPSGVYRLPPYTQIIQPYEHGHIYSKKTCLWLKGLPKIEPTNIVEPICSWVSGGSKDSHGNKRKNRGTTFRDSKTKSKTFPGIAKAMAEQWG